MPGLPKQLRLLLPINSRWIYRLGYQVANDGSFDVNLTFHNVSAGLFILRLAPFMRG